jgi:hypothetical protein
MIGNVRYAHGRREERGKGEKEKRRKEEFVK